MNRYSVLLVDDEEFVFQVMMKKLNWEEMGFSIDGYARNGVEALEKADELQPDVVMTDIKMPYMDGLTLCRKLKELNPNIKVIIFSGFDDFEFAKEAIKLEAEEYILKPIDSEELRSVFERIKVTLDKELDEKRNIDTLQEYYLKSLPLLQENFYISLLEGKMSLDTISKYISDYQIDFQSPYYVTVDLKISYSSKNGEEMEIAPFLLSVSVEKLVQEQLQGKWEHKLISYMGDILVIVRLNQESDIHILTDTFDTICKMAKRICKATVTAGIGYICDDLGTLQQSYKGAKNALSYRVFYGNMRAINIAEIETHSMPYGENWEDGAIASIIRNLKLENKERVQISVEEFCALLEESRLGVQNYQIIIMKLLIEIFNFASSYQIDLSKILEGNSDIFSLVVQAESTEELRELFLTLCNKLSDMLETKRSESGRSFVTKAEEYVKENYADKNITVDSVCNFLNVSTAYFSTMFKKATGKTFINYLTDYRMEQAIKLLETTDEKTYSIADKIGYADPNYFSYVFKKQFGVSPSKYRGNSN